MNKVAAAIFKFFLLASVLLSSIAVLSEPIVKTKNKYYYISPNSPDDIRASLNRKSPIREKKKIFHGHTEWQVRWVYWWKKSRRKCSLDDMDMRVKITYTYPKLSENYVSDETYNKFTKYFLALKKHEEKHGAFGVAAAKEIEDIIRGMQAEKTCEILSKKANVLAKQVIEKYKKLDDTFDKKTNHGKTEGVNLQ